MEQAQVEPIIIEDLVKFGEDRGFDRGFDRGAAQERLHAFGHRLGRPLTPHENEVLTRRVTTMPAERFYKFVFNASPDALEAWLADPTAQ